MAKARLSNLQIIGQNESAEFNSEERIYSKKTKARKNGQTCAFVPSTRCRKRLLGIKEWDRHDGAPTRIAQLIDL